MDTGPAMDKSIGYGASRRPGWPDPNEEDTFAVSDEFGTQAVGMDRGPERPTCSPPGPEVARCPNTQVTDAPPVERTKLHGWPLESPPT